MRLSNNKGHQCSDVLHTLKWAHYPQAHTPLLFLPFLAAYNEVSESAKCSKDCCVIYQILMLEFIISSVHEIKQT